MSDENKQQNTEAMQYDTVLAPVLFNNASDAIRTINAYVGAVFIQDRKMTSDEYGKVKEATIWLELNGC